VKERDEYNDKQREKAEEAAIAKIKKEKKEKEKLAGKVAKDVRKVQHKHTKVAKTALSRLSREAHKAAKKGESSVECKYVLFEIREFPYPDPDINLANGEIVRFLLCHLVCFVIPIFTNPFCVRNFDEEPCSTFYITTGPYQVVGNYIGKMKYVANFGAFLVLRNKIIKEFNPHIQQVFANTQYQDVLIEYNDDNQLKIEVKMTLNW